ncbi:hypothetical protein OC861_005327 [Tilletia horrida]|nr:hypothetical protein OC861_005327 [Tilletia horrida]
MSSANPAAFEPSAVGTEAADAAFAAYKQSRNSEADRLNHAEAKAQLLKKVDLLVATAIDNFQEQRDVTISPEQRNEAKQAAEQSVITLLDAEGVRELET